VPRPNSPAIIVKSNTPDSSRLSRRGTKIAARTGQVFAAGFVIVGLGWNPMLLLIGLFVFTAARQELDDLKFREQIERDGVYRI